MIVVIISAWLDKQELEQLSNLIKFGISVNDFQDLLIERDLLNTQIPQIIKEATKVMKVLAVSSTETDKSFSLMNDIVTDRRSALLKFKGRMIIICTTYLKIQ
jgi:hypothetical protein